MNEYQRQMVLLAGFMTLLTVVFLFLFVYAPEPVEGPSIGVSLPEPMSSAVNTTVQGWKSLIADLKLGMNLTSSGFQGS